MKRFLVIPSLLFLSLFSYAQVDQSPSSDLTKPDSIYRIVGTKFTQFTSSLNKLQSLLEVNEFAAVNDYGYSFDAFIRVVNKDNGWSGTSSFGYYDRSTINERAPNQASLIGFTYNYEIGYDFTHKKPFSIRPFLGFGFEYYKFSFIEDYESSSLSGLIDSNFKNYSASSFQVPYVVGLEVGSSFQINEVLLEVFVRGGYKLHIHNDKWKIDDVFEISDEIDLSSPFIGFSFGFSFLSDHRYTIRK